jgi:hypothetical protein
MDGKNIDLSLFGLGIDLPHITPSSVSFRPPSWPPPKGWVWVEDKDGKPVSRFGAPDIDLTPWFGKITTFAFGDGPQKHGRSVVMDSANADLLRILFAWRGWGPDAARAPKPKSLHEFAIRMRTIFAVCSQNGILASDLSRYPAVIDQVAKRLSKSEYSKIIAELDRLRDYRDLLGFELLDQAGIARLKSLQPDHDPEQTEYIPPRIWTYLVTRVAECIRDYNEHREAIEACFAFCVDAYERNGVLQLREQNKNRTSRKNGTSRNPFQKLPEGRTGEHSRITFYGPFAATAQRYGIKDVLEKWVGSCEGKRGINASSNYFQLIQYAAMIDLVAFTLMRIEEAASVQWDCLVWHDDPVFGRIPLIQGETTKTDPDEAGLWIASPSITPSIEALQSITKMRLASPKRWREGDNPHLINGAIEPWGRGQASRDGTVRPGVQSLAGILKAYPLLFDPRQITLTEEDLKIARSVCPTLNPEQFQVGKPWHLAWHQYRRTGAVNMFASGDISDSSMQLQMKHLTRNQSLYYGRGNTSLHLNDSVRTLLVNAFYEGMGRDLQAMRTDRFVSPYGEEHKARMFAPANDGKPVNLISEADAHHFEKVFREHRIGGRLTVLGGCMKNGPCDGDCVTSVGDCAGGDGEKPCVNVLFDRTRAPANQKRLDAIRLQLSQTPLDTPRYRFLVQEQRGLENYFAYIKAA